VSDNYSPDREEGLIGGNGGFKNAVSPQQEYRSRGLRTLYRDKVLRND
jgi:hypothetical protein